MRRLFVLGLIVGALSLSGVFAQNAPPAPAPPAPADAAALAEIQKTNAAFTAAFNAAKPADVAANFVDDGELVDEGGNLYRGKAQVQQAFDGYFKAFPGAKLTPHTGSVRVIGGDLAIEDGVSLTETSDATASNQYTLVYLKRDGAWRIASVRMIEDTHPISAHDALESLAWLVGSWVDEGPTPSLVMNCKWSEDGNFLLVDYSISSAGQVALTSSQRIGWDPLTKRVKTWIFDSDGGHGEGVGTLSGGQWIVKSTGVTPEGVAGSSTIVMTPESADKFSWETLDRIIGDVVEPATKVVVVRKGAPAAPGAAPAAGSTAAPK